MAIITPYDSPLACSNSGAISLTFIFLASPPSPAIAMRGVLGSAVRGAATARSVRVAAPVQEDVKPVVVAAVARRRASESFMVVGADDHGAGVEPEMRSPPPQNVVDRGRA